MKQKTKGGFADPRIAISRHIGWSASYNAQTIFNVPEPDDYNYAVRGIKGLLCPLLNDQVIYKDIPTSEWWSVYFVPQNQEDEFLTWLEPKPYTKLWCSNKHSTLRIKKGLLQPTTRVDKPELSDNEVLFVRGYYSNLSSKYFREQHEDVLLSRLGPPRQVVLNYDLSQFQLQEESED